MKIKVKIKGEDSEFTIKMDTDEAVNLHTVLCTINDYKMKHTKDSRFDDNEWKVIKTLLNKLDDLLH